MSIAQPDTLHGLTDAEYLELVEMDDSDPVRPRLTPKHALDEALDLAYPVPRPTRTERAWPSRQQQRPARRSA